MNLPNKLTLSRLVLAGLFVILFNVEMRYANTLALFTFAVASITDYFDGMIARRDGLITNFGVLMDPLADKILTCAAFIAFVGNGQAPAWGVIVIVSRELAITGLRLLAASKHVVLAAERYGKHKTISQIVAILAVLISISYQEWGQFGRVLFEAWIPYVKNAAVYISIILTASSGGFYLWRNRHLFLEDV